MTIRLWRSGTPSFGIELDDADVAHSWLSSGAAIGRFARALAPSEREALEHGLAHAVQASALPHSGARQPGAATEHLLADSVDISYPASSGPPAGYGDLVDALRELLDDLVSSPVAAIELHVDGPPYRGRLRHAGTEPITVRMEGLTMTTTHFGHDDTVEGTTEVRVDTAPLDGPVSPGWELPLPTIEADAEDGGFTSITIGPIEVDVQGDGVLRRAEFGWTSG
jgi:hypothetical protein